MADLLTTILVHKAAKKEIGKTMVVGDLIRTGVREPGVIAIMITGVHIVVVATMDFSTAGRGIRIKGGVLANMVDLHPLTERVVVAVHNLEKQQRNNVL